MKRSLKIYNPFHLLSAVFMIAALLWLTISIPFVYASQQKIVKLAKMENTSSSHSANEEEAANPFGSTTEEKSPGSTSLSEEYLHDHHATECFVSTMLQYHKCENAGTYIAFHGELIVPPPNAA